VLKFPVPSLEKVEGRERILLRNCSAKMDNGKDIEKGEAYHHWALSINPSSVLILILYRDGNWSRQVYAYDVNFFELFSSCFGNILDETLYNNH
jgi:hypothetical protein